MKNEEFILKKEFTGLDNYTDIRTCPIAQAVKDKGYLDVKCNPELVSCKKLVFFGLFKRTVKFKIPYCINYRAHIWAKEKQLDDKSFKLERINWFA